MDPSLQFNGGESHHMFSNTALNTPDPEFAILTGIKRRWFQELLGRMQRHPSTRTTIEQAKHLVALCVFLQSGSLHMYQSFCPEGLNRLDEAICQEFSTAFDLIEDAVENEAIYWATPDCRMPGKVAEIDYDHYDEQKVTIMALCGPRGQIYKAKAVKWTTAERPSEAILLETSGWLEYLNTLPVFVYRGQLLPAYVTTDRGPASVVTWCHWRIVMPQMYVRYQNNKVRVPNLQRIICPGVLKQRDRVDAFFVSYKSTMGHRLHLLTETELELSMFWVGIAAIKDTRADTSVRRLSTVPAADCVQSAREALKILWKVYGGAEEFIIEVPNTGIVTSTVDTQSVFFDIPEELGGTCKVRKGRRRGGQPSLEYDFEVEFEDGADEEGGLREEGMN